MIAALTEATYILFRWNRHILYVDVCEFFSTRDSLNRSPYNQNFKNKNRVSSYFIFDRFTNAYAYVSFQYIKIIITGIYICTHIHKSRRSSVSSQQVQFMTGLASSPDERTRKEGFSNHFILYFRRRNKSTL